MLYDIMMKICAWTRGGFFVVIWGMKVTSKTYFDKQKIQLNLELKYRQLKQIEWFILFDLILEIG